MQPEPRHSYRERIFDAYLESSYGPLNDLSADGMKKAADGYKRLFGDFLPASKEARILEIGCGMGGFLLCCQQLGYTEVAGIDVSAEQVEFCRRQGFDRVECADAIGYLPGQTRTFDLVVMSDVLEHLPKSEVISTLEMILRSLVPGGRLLLKIPNLSNPLNLRSRYVDFTHESGLTVESTRQILRVAGFTVVATRGSFRPHRRLVARWLFDHLLWRLFLIFYSHTMHLSREVVRGKSLIAVAERPASEGPVSELGGS
jgi:SAM-dependent methyltransferase